MVFANPSDRGDMSFLEESLVGKRVEAVMSDSEVTYLMFADGTQVTIRGWVVVEPQLQGNSDFAR